MPSQMQPEFFILMGIDIFLATSLITAIFDKHFPSKIPYICQLAALAGYGNLIVSREFLQLFDPYMRFWYSLIYLIVAVASIFALSAYLGFSRKMWKAARIFTYVVGIPVLMISTFFISTYTAMATHPILILPPLTFELTFLTVILFDSLVVSLGIYLFIKPKWWHIAVPTTIIIIGASIYTLLKPEWKAFAFLICATVLGVACAAVLGASIYVLIKLWREG